MTDSADLALAEALASGRAQWPGVALPDQALAAFIAGHAILPPMVRERGADLFLAAACAAGDPAAHAAFERALLSRVEVYVSRLRLDPPMLDELRQQLRIRLLGGPQPRIAAYRGTGPLGGWVRVAALRAAFNLLEAAGVERKRKADESLDVHLGRAAVPEAELLRARCQPVLKAAVKAALAAVDERDRAIVRFHFVEGLSVERIGTIYGVHRATIARRLADVRRRLLRAVQAHVHAELGVTPSEFRSLVAALREDLRISITSALGG